MKSFRIVPVSPSDTPAAALLRRPARPVRRLAIVAAWLLAGAGSAWGQVAVNQILFPVNIGRTLDATVDIDYTRTSAAAAVIQVAIALLGSGAYALKPSAPQAALA